MAVLILLGGVGASVVANKDVLPNVDIPVVVVVWTYTGLDPTDMASRVTTYSEFALSNNVNGISRMESTTLQGTTIERIYFENNVSIDLAISQVVAATNSIRAVMPPGIQPPVIMRFAASAVPVIQLDDLLRVAIEVPQYASQGVRDGVEAKTTVPEMPGRMFPGKVARSTVALLYSSRTMTAEVDVPNPDGVLRPGLYVNVSLAIPRTTPIVNVPADALIFNQKGMQAAVVQPDATVKMRKIEIARDLGTTVDVKSGLDGGEKLVMSAPPQLADGSKIEIADGHNETRVSDTAEAQR